MRTAEDQELAAGCILPENWDSQWKFRLEPQYEAQTMRNTLVTLFTVFVIAAPGAVGADESLGTWELNMGKSKFNPTAPVKSLTTTREAAEGGVNQTTIGEQVDGTKINSRYTAKYDGKEYPVTGAPWDTISIKQVDSNTFTTVTKNTGGKYKSTGRTVISKDGKTMTTTSKGINAEGKPFNYTMVWEKQSGDTSGIDATTSTHSSPITPTKPKPGKQ
jgi:hypothetical protein